MHTRQTSLSMFTVRRLYFERLTCSTVHEKDRKTENEVQYTLAFKGPLNAPGQPWFCRLDRVWTKSRGERDQHMT